METLNRSHSGWQEEEISLLRREVLHACEKGEPLCSVFQRMARELGRKPNSIRNFYYMHFRSPSEPDFKRAEPFELFTKEEIHTLIREVLQGLGQGKSVRSCVMEMAEGNQSKMLRLQNKYRSILRKKPDYICEVADELSREGLPFLNPTDEKSCPSRTVQDPDLHRMIEEIEKLAHRLNSSRMKDHTFQNQSDLLRMKLEDLQKAASELVLICKEVCADELSDSSFTEKRQELIDHLSSVENLCS